MRAFSDRFIALVCALGVLAALMTAVRADGQFDVVWKTPNLVPGEAWSKYLPGSKDLEADWVTLKCGNDNTVTKKCGGAS